MVAGRGIAGDTAINVLAIAFSLVGGFVYQSILAWHLGPTGRGDYGVWIAIATIMAVLFTLGTDRAVQIHLISNRITVAQATCTAMLIGVVGSIVAMAVLWLGFQNDWQLLANVSPQNRIIALLVVPAVSLPLAIQLLLAGLSHFAALAVFSMVRALLQVGLAAFLFVVLDWDIEAAYTTFVLSSGITLVAYLLFLKWQYKLHTALVSPKMAATLLGYSLRYLPARLGNVLNANLVLLMLVFFASKHDIGLFSLALALMGQSLVISNALDRAVQPRMSVTPDGRSDLIAQCCRISTLLYGVILLVLLLLADIAVPVLFSKSFQGSIPLLWLLAPGIWLRGSSKPLRTYFIGSNRPGIVSISIIAELVVTLISLAVFYPFAGIFGAAFGTTLGQASGTLVLVLKFHSCSKHSFAETWLWNKVDTQCLKDRLIATFKIRLKPLNHFSCANSDAVEREIVSASVSEADRSLET